MKIIKMLILAGLSIALSASAQQTTSTETNPVRNVSNRQFALDRHVAPIKSPADLEGYLKMTASKKNPLLLLSPEARNRFLESLTYNETGVTSYSYADLEQELTPSQIYEVLSLIGSQGSVYKFKGAKVKTKRDKELMTTMTCYGDGGSEDTTSCENGLTNHWCASRATCEWKNRSNCMKGC